jgi:hypothetical protein
MTPEERFERIESSQERFARNMDRLERGLDKIQAKLDLFVERQLEAHAEIDARFKAFDDRWKAFDDRWRLIEAGLNSLRETVERYIQARGGNGQGGTR